MRAIPAKTRSTAETMSNWKVVSFCRCLLTAVIVVAFTSSVRAQFDSDRPITVICASGAGGIPDVITRIVVDHMARSIGRQIVIQNEAGAGGTIGMASVRKAKPDGSVILAVGSPIATVQLLYPKSGLDVERDLEPVSIIGISPMVMTINGALPVRDYRAFVTYAKDHPNELTAGSNGRGTSGHFAIELLNQLADLKIRYVPYRTTPQAQADLMGGHLNLMMTSPMSDQAQRGLVRMLAVTSQRRWPIVPDLPSLSELGLSKFEAVSWTSMLVPKHTPADIVKKIDEAIRSALADPEVQARLSAVGAVVPEHLGPDALRRQLSLEIKRYSDVLRDVN